MLECKVSEFVIQLLTEKLHLGKLSHLEEQECHGIGVHNTAITRDSLTQFGYKATGE